MVDFHDDPEIDAMAQALLFKFGLDPCVWLPREMVPMDWVPIAAEIVRDLHDDGVRLVIEESPA